jgi:hypothetical protein
LFERYKQELAAVGGSQSKVATHIKEDYERIIRQQQGWESVKKEQANNQVESLTTYMNKVVR